MAPGLFSVGLKPDVRCGVSWFPAGPELNNSETMSVISECTCFRDVSVFAILHT
jgi:hypothetical protein